MYHSFAGLLVELNGGTNDRTGILGANMATVTLSHSTVVENPQVGTIVGFIGVTGEGASENATFRLIDPGSGRFEIKPISTEGILNWVLVVKNSVSGDGSSLFDFENDAVNDFTFKISATGDMGTVVATTTFTVSVTDNTAPTEIILSNSSVVEHAQTGTVIGYLWAFDPDDDDTLTYTLTDDAGGRFDIVDGNLVVKDGSLLDYQAATSHQVIVEARDSDGNVHTANLTINVSDAVDIRNGTATNDRLLGSAGADLFKGLSGNDTLYGLAGDDILSGGAGKDFLYGGAGKDTFVFDIPRKKGEFDQVMDFVAADDTLQFSLSAIQSTIKSEKHVLAHGKKAAPTFGIEKALQKGKIEKKFFTVGDKAKDSNDYLYYNKKFGFVYLDLDGSGKKHHGITLLKLKPGAAVSADDFTFI
jgi:Ca2+-binding RTX toxin-like protein